MHGALIPSAPELTTRKMDMGVRKLPKKRKFDPAELEENHPTVAAVCAPVSVVVQSIAQVYLNKITGKRISKNTTQATAVDYSRTLRITEETVSVPRRQTTIDLGEWCDHRVLAKQGDWYLPGVIREAVNNEVSQDSSLSMLTGAGDYVCKTEVYFLLFRSTSFDGFLSQFSVIIGGLNRNIIELE